LAQNAFAAGAPPRAPAYGELNARRGLDHNICRGLDQHIYIPLPNNPTVLSASIFGLRDPCESVNLLADKIPPPPGPIVHVSGLHSEIRTYQLYYINIAFNQTTVKICSYVPGNVLPVFSRENVTHCLPKSA